MRRPQLMIAVVIAAIGLISYFANRSVNPVTGEKQAVGGITPEQEVALGLQAAPEMAQQFGGLDPVLRRLGTDGDALRCSPCSSETTA